MTMAAFQSGVGPYLALLAFAVLPTALWRVLGVVLSRGLSETSPFVEWVRMVATALLSAVVIKLLLTPSGALVAVPLSVRLGSVVAGTIGFFLARRSLLAGVVAGEAMLAAGVWWWS